MQLIKKCIEVLNENKKEHDKISSLNIDSVCYTQNYRRNDGSFGTVSLSETELMQIRTSHKEHCKKIIKDCANDFSREADIRIVVFDKRADKVFIVMVNKKRRKRRRKRDRLFFINSFKAH